MKKFFIIICAVLLIFCTVACTGNNEDGQNTTDSLYEINLKLEGNTLSATQKTTVTNTYAENLTELVFNLYANAYSENTPDKAYTSKLSSYGSISIASISVNGKDLTNFTLSENGQILTIPVNLPTIGSVGEIFMEYTVTIPQSNLRLSMGENSYSLANFYPQLAVYEDGFRTDKFTTIGDPLYSNVADYEVTITLPSEYIVAGSCKAVTQSENNNLKTIAYSGKNIRDFALCANKNFKTASAKYADTEIIYYYTSDADYRNTLSCGTNAIKTFSETFGAYPYPTYSIVQTPFYCGGMEFSGLVYIADDVSDIADTVIHETAHQWWYGMVGSDSINESYLDEGLTTFSVSYYYLLNGDEEKFNAQTNEALKSYMLYEKLQKMRKTQNILVLNKSIYEYTSYQYNMLAYNKGCLLFKSLYDTLGKDKFNKAMQEYVKCNRFGIANTDSLISSINSACKTDVSGLVKGWLGENVTATFAINS